MNAFEEQQTIAPGESIVDLLKDLRDESIALMRQQIELAKQETSEKISKLTRNAAMLAVGAVVAYTGVIFLLNGFNYLGAWGFVSAGLSQSAAVMIMSFIIGAIVAITGYVLVQKAAKTLKHTSPLPEKTIQSMKEDREWIARKRH
jgi:uncharacterized membrane protein YqjE